MKVAKMVNGDNKMIVLLIITGMITMTSCRILDGNNFPSDLAGNSIDKSVILINTPYPPTEKSPSEPNAVQITDNGIKFGSKQTFEEAVSEMKSGLAGDDVPCSMYDPPTPSFMAPGRRISEAKCLEHIWNTKRDEETDRRVKQCQAKYTSFSGVVGGRIAKPGEFPHMGALGWEKKEGGWAFLCGSFLVSDKFVVTAAHCHTADDASIAHPTAKIIRFGVENIMNDQSNSPVDIKILKFKRHPMYRPPPYKTYDVAVVELAKRVTFDQFIQPACLLNQKAMVAMVTGWGVVDSISGSQKTSNDLRMAEVDIVPTKKCTRKLRSKQDSYWRVQSSQICAIRKNADTCGGDSGGPLQTKLSVGTQKSIYNVIGITSFGFICGRDRFPSIYTRVASFIDWIEEVVWKGETSMAIQNRAVPEEAVAVHKVQQFSEGSLFWRNKIGSKWTYLSQDAMKDLQEIDDNNI